jgi:hypothetical protein
VRTGEGWRFVERAYCYPYRSPLKGQCFRCELRPPGAGTMGRVAIQRITPVALVSA